MTYISPKTLTFEDFLLRERYRMKQEYDYSGCVDTSSACG